MLNFGNKEFRNLQEQVLKNAQDIETLKGREDLQIVIVNELPEVGNPNYIYLVAKDGGESPDVYDEYIWLEDEERYEKIGGVSIDLTNYVTLDSEQTISGSKTFTGTNTFLTNVAVSNDSNTNKLLLVNAINYAQLIFGSATIFDFSGNQNLVLYGDLRTTGEGTKDIGANNKRWRDLYLGGAVKYSSHSLAEEVGFFVVKEGNLNVALIGSSFSMFRSLIPVSTNIYNLGRSDFCWNDLYLTGNITDGVNTVTVANIASKVTSTFISGTFDSNGESTIDTEQAGTPEGLFIFTYGNCQCFLRLTATMVQNADTTPIRVACPMIYNSDTVNGWLNITKSGNILILKITDGTNHVDSGYSWTLTKTNLI